MPNNGGGYASRTPPRTGSPAVEFQPSMESTSDYATMPYVLTSAWFSALPDVNPETVRHINVMLRRSTFVVRCPRRPHRESALDEISE